MFVKNVMKDAWNAMLKKAQIVLIALLAIEDII